MSKSEVEVTDEEIEALMAELEADNEKMVGDQAAVKPVEEKVIVEPVPVVEKPVPAPVVAEAKPTPKQKKQIEAVIAAAEPQVIATTESSDAEVDTIAVSAEVEGDTLAANTSVDEDALSPESEKDAGSTSSGLQFFIDPHKFRAETSVSETTLDKCMIEQNSLRSYYGALAARAEAQVARSKARFEIAEAMLDNHHRKALALIHDKVTEKMVDVAIKLDPRWFRAKNTLIEAQTIADINKSNVESLKDRVSMIMQLGADRRDEMRGQTRTMIANDERDDFRNRALNSAGGKAAA